MTEHDFDVVLVGGSIVDGTGAPAFTGDVALRGDEIAAVGEVRGRARRTIDVQGALITPGFIDVHTHYDGQATWDTALAPSSWHGVTTVVMGNCGVGFAPVRATDRDRLVELMEGVEDIPGTALHEGLPWEWETFPEYLDFLDQSRYDIDICAQLPHAPLRVYVMGEAGAEGRRASTEQAEQMARLARDAVHHGAFGFTTSRTINHRSVTGDPTPSLRAGEAELMAIAVAVAATGRGVLQVVSDFDDVDAEFDMLTRIGRRSGRPISVSVTQTRARPDLWRTVLDRCEAATRSGVPMLGQVAARPVGLLLGLELTLSPFNTSPTYRGLKWIPLRERLHRLRDYEVRATILHEAQALSDDFTVGARQSQQFNRIFPLGDPPDYEPSASSSIEALAARHGMAPIEFAYDYCVAGEGDALLYLPLLNYAEGNLDSLRGQLSHPAAIPGLGDGGAHVGTICDSSFTTSLLQIWARDRAEGLPVEDVVNRQCRRTALAIGLHDRGVIAPGFLADLNVIDFENLTLRTPAVVHDLPAGGSRLLQRADGYVYVFKRGIAVHEHDRPTGATPGRLVRSGDVRAPAIS